MVEARLRCTAPSPERTTPEPLDPQVKVSTPETASADQPPAADIARLAERDRDDLTAVLSVLRERVEHEFRVTERLEGKARQEFTLAAGFFVIAQAGAFASFGASGVTTSERFVVLAAAMLAAVSLVIVAARLRAVERLRKTPEVMPGTVFEWCRDQARPKSATAHLIWAMSELAGRWTAGNEARATQAKVVAAAAGWSLALAGVELALALVVRV
jgi:hypothetical protein